MMTKQLGNTQRFLLGSNCPVAEPSKINGFCYFITKKV